MLRALRAEFVKLKRSPVPTWSALVVVAWPLMTVGVAAAGTGSVRGMDWTEFLGMSPQSISSWFGVILGGFVAAYVFGREYGDATIRTMLTLPVRRESFVVAKVLVLLTWVLALAVLSAGAHVLFATVLHLDGFAWGPVYESLGSSLRAIALIAATLPFVGWLAVVGPGYLAPMIFSAVAYTSGVLFLQTDWAKWWPWSMPLVVQGLVWIPGNHVGELALGSWAVLAAVFAIGVTLLIVQIDFADSAE
jgi:ABC-2 type transport system permease protein